jgi:HAD superfamily hydrolase (TIGR01509 family)
MRYRTILFDLGDTLIQVPRPGPIYQRLLARYGYAFDLAQLEATLKIARCRQDELCPHWRFDDLRLDAAACAARRQIHVETIVEMARPGDRVALTDALYGLYVNTELFTLFPDVSPTLRHLTSQGYRLGIVSNWEPRLRELCAAHDIDEFFDFAVISEVEGYTKPHPYLYQRALELAGEPPQTVVHVGDKLLEDVGGATALGITAVLLDRSDTLDCPHEPRIRSLAELPKVLAGD